MMVERGFSVYHPPRMTTGPVYIEASKGTDCRVAVVWSRYNDFVTRALLDGAVDEFRRRTGSESGLVVMQASGSFEVPMLVHEAAESGLFDAVVALGCIIKGETTHDQHLASAVTSSLLTTARDTGVPVGLGVLTVDTAEQARERAGGLKGNKGVEAMAAAMETWGTIAAWRTSKGAR